MQHNNLYSVLLHRETCPKCKSMGNDKSGDNLAVYADGHAICYSCRYYRSADGISKIRANDGFSHTVIERSLHLPADADINYPHQCMLWLSKYGITKHDAINNGMLWSDNGIRIKQGQADNLLLFPMWAKDELLAWQGRYFGHASTIPKYVTKGKTEEVFHFLCNGKPDGKLRDVLVVTEDMISAIKVSKIGISAMPLFGNNFVSRIDRLLKLTRMNYTVLLWLDPNMHIKSIKESNVARLKGLQTCSILSRMDPKEHTLDEIDEYIDKAMGRSHID